MSKHGLGVKGAKDAFAKKARPELESPIGRLPLRTGTVTFLLLGQMESANAQVAFLEKRTREPVKQIRQMTLLKTVPGVGDILAAAIALEIGDVDRFASAQRLASYAGTTPHVHSSGGKTRYGKLRPDVNRYLRRALVEAANSISSHRNRYPERHGSILYNRIRKSRGHGKAIGASARRLAETCFHVLHKMEPYRDPQFRKRSSQEGVSAISS